MWKVDLKLYLHFHDTRERHILDNNWDTLACNTFTNTDLKDNLTTQILAKVRLYGISNPATYGLTLFLSCRLVKSAVSFGVKLNFQSISTISSSVLG